MKEKEAWLFVAVACLALDVSGEDQAIGELMRKGEAIGRNLVKEALLEQFIEDAGGEVEKSDEASGNETKPSKSRFGDLFGPSSEEMVRKEMRKECNQRLKRIKKMFNMKKKASKPEGSGGADAGSGA